ncbi:uncharacterized protein LOC121177152 [Toxotes jaculatrix]|uniref:uncharacterized protein LOC121177152 n=1 Tax=Toxotes jaculatrix TaxID=941984 RepID=UPI001B3AD215|nr:uncharacterized protein LOC121177152 [Toxotes jaculatrix]
MSVNSSSSSSSNHSLLHPHLLSINSSLPVGDEAINNCFITKPGSLIFISYNITYILLLLPVSIFVLYLGVQRWWRQRLSSTSAKTSHSDIFTYHMATMELVGVVGNALCCSGVYRRNFSILFLGLNPMSFTWYGEMFFHILTCVERYLAVVHPIIYLSLREERGIRIRNITIGCVWMFCFAWTSVSNMNNVISIVDLCLLFFSSVVISFFSLSVLCTLIRPKPGEQSRDRQRVDQSKQRAFYTIMAILGVLLLRCMSNFTWATLYTFRPSHNCVLITFEIWFNLPSSLVLPLLFLHRSGKLVCLSQIRSLLLM